MFGLNVRIFLDAVTGPIILNCSPVGPSVRHWIQSANSERDLSQPGWLRIGARKWRDSAFAEKAISPKHEAAVSMGFRPRLPGAQFTLLSWLGATYGAAHGQSLLLGDFHDYIVHVCPAARWSILTSAKELLAQDRHCITPANY